MRVFIDDHGCIVVERDGRWHSLVFEDDGDHWNTPMEEPDSGEIQSWTELKPAREEPA